MRHILDLLYYCSLYLSYIWCIHNLVCVIMIQKFHFFSFLIWMRTFQTDNRTFKIRITTVDQCSLDCCSGVLISTLSKYLSEKLYHYTNHDFFFRIRLVAISLFVTWPNIGEQWELSIIVILHQNNIQFTNLQVFPPNLTETLFFL